MKIQRLVTSGIMAFSLLASSAAPLAVMAEEDNDETAPVEQRVVDVVCLKTAIDTRENAIISALDAFHVSLNAAHETRREALKSAWDKTEKQERRKALRDARKAFKLSGKSARTTLREARKDAWDQYKADAKVCGHKASSDDGSAREDQSSSL